MVNTVVSNGIPWYSMCTTLKLNRVTLFNAIEMFYQLVTSHRSSISSENLLGKIRVR